MLGYFEVSITQSLMCLQDLFAFVHTWRTSVHSLGLYKIWLQINLGVGAKPHGNGHPLIWWRHSIMLNCWLSRGMFSLCITDSCHWAEETISTAAGVNTMGASKHNIKQDTTGLTFGHFLLPCTLCLLKFWKLLHFLKCTQSQLTLKQRSGRDFCYKKN